MKDLLLERLHAVLGISPKFIEGRLRCWVPDHHSPDTRPTREKYFTREELRQLGSLFLMLSVEWPDESYYLDNDGQLPLLREPGDLVLDKIWREQITVLEIDPPPAPIELPPALCWISFCDPALPEGSQFLGACIVPTVEPSTLDPTRDLKAALTNACKLRCNPGGEARFQRVMPSIAKHIRPQWIGRLLTKEDCAAFEKEIEPHGVS